MKIKIEDRECELREGTSLSEYISEMGLDSENMETKPLAVKLGYQRRWSDLHIPHS